MEIHFIPEQQNDAGFIEHSGKRGSLRRRLRDADALAGSQELGVGDHLLALHPQLHLQRFHIHQPHQSLRLRIRHRIPIPIPIVGGGAAVITERRRQEAEDVVGGGGNGSGSGAGPQRMPQQICSWASPHVRKRFLE